MWVCVFVCVIYIFVRERENRCTCLLIKYQATCLCLVKINIFSKHFIYMTRVNFYITLKKVNLTRSIEKLKTLLQFEFLFIHSRLGVGAFGGTLEMPATNKLCLHVTADGVKCA